MSESELPAEQLPALDPTVAVLPLKDLILVRSVSVDDTEIETPGGIIIPTRNAEAQKYEFGVVIRVGLGAFSGAYGTRIPMDVQVGDKIAFVERAGWEFRTKGVAYRVIRELDAWVVLSGPSIDALSEE